MKPKMKPKMKLSEAMQAGARLHPQSFCATIGWQEDEVFSTCALAAAYAGIGRDLAPFRSDPRAFGTIRNVLFHEGLLRETNVVHPVFGTQTTLENAIVSLNDAQHWTREAIADWLDSLGY